VQFLLPQSTICRLLTATLSLEMPKGKGDSGALKKEAYKSHLSERSIDMKYLVAWGLGIPGVLIVIWFLMSHH
jgi:hypothetical protein